MSITNSFFKDKTFSAFSAALILVNLLYLPALFGHFLLDDHLVILGHMGVLQEPFWDVLTVKHSDFFRPVGYLVLWLFSRLFDHNVFGYHLANLLVFNAILILFYRLAKLITRDEFVAGWAAFLYGIHPINSMIVNYITASGMAIYIIFLQLSLWALLMYSDDRQRRNFYPLSILFFCLALLSHEISLIFPLVAWWVLIYREGSWKKPMGRVVPYACIAVLYFIFRSNVHHLNSSVSGLKQLISHIPLSYIASFSDLLGWYVSKLFWPHDIIFLWSVGCTNLWVLPTAIAVLALVSAMCFLCFRWRNSLEGFAVVFFLIGFLPAGLACFNYYPQDPFIEPHWFYFSSWGFFLLAALWLKRIKNRCSPRIFILIAGCLIVVNSVLLLNNHRHWRDQETYCRYWLSLNQRNLTPYFGLGKSMIEQGHYREAIGVFKEGINNSRIFNPMIMAELGYAEFKLGHLPQAQFYFNSAQRMDPSYSTVYHYWGMFYDAQGDLQKAKEYYGKALSLCPRDKEFLRLVIDVQQRQENIKTHN